jgi:hypothetical protein
MGPEMDIFIAMQSKTVIQLHLCEAEYFMSQQLNLQL